jgi:hypothetical protein
MKLNRGFLILLSLLWLGTSCSSSSSSGGGGSTGGGGGETPPTPTPTTYSNADLEGTWKFKADRQISPFTLTGTMTFDGGLRLLRYENDYCPGRQIVDGEFWLWADGFVKGRNYAFCSDPVTYTKYAMNFTGSDKKTMVGLMDLHFFNAAGEELYERYDITYRKQDSSTSKKIQNPTNQIKALKSVR